MGRDWYWVGSKSSSNSKRGERDTTTSTSSTSSGRSNGQSATTASGCMSAVFHFFDFHNFQFPLHHQQSSSFKPNSFFPQDPITIPKGVEAPRNSLESISEEASILPSTNKDEENLNIPMGIQIKTSTKMDTRSKAGGPSNDSCTEISYSPGAKTPNLLARLMGLDPLSDYSSPSSSSTLGTPNLQEKSHLHNHCRPCRQPLHSKPITAHRNSVDGDITGTRSLPETPRISSARRSDVEHRLSLQLNKENVCVSEELEFSRFSSLRRKEFKQEDENRSPREYARQIVKQVKESVSRKVGIDKTNANKNREQARENRKLVNQIKSKKNSKAFTKVIGSIADESSPGRHSTPSCSPRLYRLEPKYKPISTTTTTFSQPSTKQHIPLQPLKTPFQSPLSSSPKAANYTKPQTVKASTKPKFQPVQDKQQQKHQRPIKKCKKADSERFSSRLTKPPQTSAIIRNKQEDPFVLPSTINRANINPDNKKCKKTPFSNEFLNITTVPSLQKQVTDAQKSKQSSHLSCCSSQTYKQEARDTHIARNNDIDYRCNGDTTTTTTAYGAEYEYVTRILRRTGIDKDTPLSFSSWFSPQQLDPSIFYYLEHFTITTSKKASGGQLGLRCNRKLLFQLVDEILVDFLKPCMNMKPWVNSSNRRDNNGSELIEWLCSKIRSYPCADCRVLEDIDALIDKDLPQMKQQISVAAFEEEGEGIVSEIERDILDTLVHETAVDFGFGVGVLWEENGTV